MLLEVIDMDRYDDMDYAVRMVNRAKMENKADIFSNSCRNHGAQSVVSKKSRKQKSRSSFRKLSISLISVALCMLVMVNVNSHIKHVSSEEYISDVLMDEYVELSHNNSDIEVPNYVPDYLEDVNRFMNVLKSECNGNELLALYVVDQIYGDNGFDMVCKSLGYSNSDDYLVNNGYFDASISSSGETVYAKYANKIKFKNALKDEYEEWLNNYVDVRRKGGK